jgi:hypothetical protein
VQLDDPPILAHEWVVGDAGKILGIPAFRRIFTDTEYTDNNPLCRQNGCIGHSHVRSFGVSTDLHLSLCFILCEIYSRMPRKSIGSRTKDKNEDSFDYSNLIYPGVTMLKFGRTGKPHERHFKLSRDLRFLKYRSGWFTSKMGSSSVSKYLDRNLKVLFLTLFLLLLVS